MVRGFLGISLIRGDSKLDARTLLRGSSEYLNSYIFGAVPLLVLILLATAPELSLAVL